VSAPTDVLARRLKTSGLLISLGLAIQAGTLYWMKALSFIAFAGGGLLLVAAGILLFLYAVVSH